MAAGEDEAVWQCYNGRMASYDTADGDAGTITWICYIVFVLEPGNPTAPPTLIPSLPLVSHPPRSHPTLVSLPSPTRRRAAHRPPRRPAVLGLPHALLLAVSYAAPPPTAPVSLTSPPATTSALPSPPLIRRDPIPHALLLSPLPFPHQKGEKNPRVGYPTRSSLGLRCLGLAPRRSSSAVDRSPAGRRVPPLFFLPLFVFPFFLSQVSIPTVLLCARRPPWTPEVLRSDPHPGGLADVFAEVSRNLDGGPASGSEPQTPTCCFRLLPLLLRRSHATILTPSRTHEQQEDAVLRQDLTAVDTVATH
nr:proline-rich protein 36-like [Aegilops tauschii subsp. strangulata]